MYHQSKNYIEMVIGCGNGQNDMLTIHDLFIKGT